MHRGHLAPGLCGQADEHMGWICWPKWQYILGNLENICLPQRSGNMSKIPVCLAKHIHKPYPASGPLVDDPCLTNLYIPKLSTSQAPWIVKSAPILVALGLWLSLSHMYLLWFKSWVSLTHSRPGKGLWRRLCRQSSLLSKPSTLSSFTASIGLSSRPVVLKQVPWVSSTGMTWHFGSCEKLESLESQKIREEAHGILIYFLGDSVAGSRLRITGLFAMYYGLPASLWN